MDYYSRVFARAFLIFFFFDFLFFNAAFCESGGYTYKIGELMYMPNSYSEISEASCNMCKCGPNGPTRCGKLYCDLHRKTGHCEKWSNGAPDGQCCPNCCECFSTC